MYESQSDDLSDILETLQELSQTLEEQARVRIQLEVDKSVLARRLYEALAAERRQRCRATSSRAFAKRAQAAMQPVIAVQKEMVSLKREIADQKKSFQEERRILEEKVCFLEGEILRIKEEKEAALAVADFAKEDAAFNKGANQVTSSAAVPNSEVLIPASLGSGSNVLMAGTYSSRVALPPPPAPPSKRSRPSQLQLLAAEEGSLHPRNVNALWTGSRELERNPLPLSTAQVQEQMQEKVQEQFRPRRSVHVQSSRYKAVAGFQTARQLMHASRSEEEINKAGNSQISQSYSTVQAGEQLVPSDDDCIMVQEDVADERQEVKSEVIKNETPQPEKDFIQEEAIWTDSGSVSEDTGTGGLTDTVKCTSQGPLKKLRKNVRKKRLMFSTPLHDDFIG